MLMLRSGITEIDHLTRLAFCKEGSITARRRLRDFILHREEVGAVLACVRIRVDDDPFLLVMHLSPTYRVRLLVRTIDHMRHTELQRITRQVVLIAYNMGNIIAFELEYQLQVITEVIHTQTET